MGEACVLNCSCPFSFSFLKKSEKKDKSSTKDNVPKLFEDKNNDLPSNSISMTQMLGLCSGKFDDSSSSMSAMMTSQKGAVSSSGDQSVLDFHDDNANNSFTNFTFKQSQKDVETNSAQGIS